LIVSGRPLPNFPQRPFKNQTRAQPAVEPEGGQRGAPEKNIVSFRYQPGGVELSREAALALSRGRKPGACRAMPGTGHWNP